MCFSGVLQKHYSKCSLEIYAIILSMHTHINRCGLAWWLTLIIPGTREAEIRRTVVQYQPGKNSTNRLGVVVCTCHPSYVGGINRRTMV
jgi:hypothetical protein